MEGFPTVIKGKNVTVHGPNILEACYVFNIVHEDGLPFGQIFEQRYTSSFQFSLLLENLLSGPISNKFNNYGSINLMPILINSFTA